MCTFPSNWSILLIVSWTKKNFYVSVLTGPVSHFHNVRLLNDCVYCTFCKSLIGKKAVDHDILFINRHRLLRIDPRTITTHCLPTVGSRNSITHGHTLLIASIENAVTDPIPRLSLRSRNNTSRTIKTTCQEVKNFLADSSRSRSNRLLVPISRSTLQIALKFRITKMRAFTPRHQAFLNVQPLSLVQWRRHGKFLNQIQLIKTKQAMQAPMFLSKMLIMLNSIRFFRISPPHLD